MAKRTLVIPHKLTQEEALKRLQDKAQQERQKHAGEISARGVQEKLEWEGNVGIFEASAMGVRVSGTIEVKELEIVVATEIHVPFLLSKILGNQIEAAAQEAEQMIKKELEKTLKP